MQEKKAIAIFGGSFNPPLNSHIFLATEILNSKINVEKIIFVPVSTMYNKNGLESNLHRYNMLNIICKKYKNFEVSDIEINSNKQLYTIETLNLLSMQYYNKTICFVLGTDNLKELSTWKTPEEILKKYKVIVLQRGKDSANEIIENDEFLKKYKNSFIILKNKCTSLSSTLIRSKIKDKQDVSDYMPEEVLNYINKNKLYK
jgi:nicotinate-nucleotide adenylyltransferase